MSALQLSSVASMQPFDASELSSLVNNRNSRFHLNLSNSTLIGVLQAYQAHKRMQSPRFTTTAVAKKIAALQNTIGGDKIMPIDVCDFFWIIFGKYLRGKRLRPSTIHNYFDTIRAALVWGASHQCPVSETFKDYKVDKYAKTKVALTPSQISHIYYYEIDKHHKELRAMADKMKVRGFSFTFLKKVQAQFVLQCNIGQRYSDAIRVTPECFDETRTIFSIIQQKTGNKAVVNLAKYAIDKAMVFDILRRYDYTAPCAGKHISVFGRHLHVLLRCIGGEFNKTITTENKIHGEIVGESMKMWQAISSHTARRSFATYWGKDGKLNMMQLQRMTGHTDLRSLQRYVIFDELD